MLQDIFNALAGGATQGGGQAQQQQAGGGDLLSGLLGSVLGGGQASPGTSPMGGQAVDQSQPQGEGLTDLLGSLLGGQSAVPAQPVSQPQAGGEGLGGLLGSLLGGGGATQASNQVTGTPLMNLVSSGQNPMVNSLIQPVVDKVALKLGIPPAIAMTVVTFAIHYMLSNHGTRLANGADMSGILQQHTDHEYLHSTGMTQQLAQQTGMKPAQAASALSEVFKLLGQPSQTN